MKQHVYLVTYGNIEEHIGLAHTKAGAKALARDDNGEPIVWDEHEHGLDGEGYSIRLQEIQP